MIKDLPVFINLLFGLTVIITLVWFNAAIKSRGVLIFTVIWVALQSALGLSGIFQNTEVLPPRLMLLGVLPMLLLILITFLTTKGRAMIDGINLKTLTYFHTIRLPVEITLLLLSYQKLVSPYMTFEGTNFDVFSGLTAALVAYLAFRKEPLNKKLLLGWNILCLILLFNVVITAILALPFPLQQISFDRPNVAVLYFPFNLLPSFVVPAVLFAHLAAIRRLTRKEIVTN